MRVTLCFRCTPLLDACARSYHKQQSLALNFQLPELERMADAEDLPEPPKLHWSRSANMLNPGLLLERELSGGCNASCMQRAARLPHTQEQQGKAERFGACVALASMCYGCSGKWHATVVGITQAGMLLQQLDVHACHALCLQWHISLQGMHASLVKAQPALREGNWLCSALCCCLALC